MATPDSSTPEPRRVSLPLTGPTARLRRYFIRGLVGLVAVAIVAFLFRPLEQSREGARRAQCRNNLKQIGLALHLYHDRWGSFPPAYTTDEDGRQVHSWRTLILPFLDQKPLYDEYQLGEPWDGPNNEKLRDRRVDVLECPENFGKSETSYLAVVGPNTAWPGSRPANREDDFPDGLSSTILVVEVEDSGVHWMEPRDLLFDEMSFEINGASGNAISSRHKVAGFWPWSGPTPTVNVLFADGSTSRLPADTAPETIRAWITASGGEKVPSPP